MVELAEPTSLRPDTIGRCRCMTRGEMLGGDAAERCSLIRRPFASGYRVLDIGCARATGRTNQAPESRCRVVGLDRTEDPRARAPQGSRAALSIQLHQGFSDELPYAEEYLVECSRLSCFTI